MFRSQVWFTKPAIKNHISMNFIATKWKGSFKNQNIIKVTQIVRKAFRILE